MKFYPKRIPPDVAKAAPRIPQFHAVRVRIREDGWTPRRQAEFIGHLAQTRSVTEAARRVGMARETAYRLRGKEWSESFCAAWDAAMADAARRSRGTVTPDGHDGKSHHALKPKRMVTNAELMWRMETGLWHLHFYRGVFKSAWRKGDDSALLRLCARLDRAKTPDEWARRQQARRRCA